MSIPPNVIKIKRKRDEDAPVTFLQFDGEAKRHRSDSNWVYQRRTATTVRTTVVTREDARPTIHVSGKNSSPNKKRDLEPSQVEPSVEPSSAADSRQQAAVNNPSRRFHISRSLLKSQAAANNASPGVTKRPRTGPAIFVEKTRRKIVPKQAKDRKAGGSITPSLARTQSPTPEPEQGDANQTTRKLKRPGTTSRIRVDKDAQARAPLPASLMSHHEEDMTKIADDLNKWVIGEIGANLESMDQERRKAQSTSHFRPKAPAQRYRQRHPETASSSSAVGAGNAMDVDDQNVSDASEEEGDGDDWIIEEYIRIPLKAMAQDISPSDVGVIVLDGEEATALFYGPENDSDDDFAEDDEDENAENHYTADYPEDEVDSEDEFGRQAYHYRNRNASDDEEFDNETYESGDDMVIDRDGDEDAAMARIKAYMRRHAARE